MPIAPPRRSEEESYDHRVERLSRELSEAVNAAPDEDHATLRDYANELVREDTAPVSAKSGPTRRARLSFFALAVWLVVIGAVLGILVPPAGVVCLLMAGLSGVLAALFGRGEVRNEPTTGDDPGGHP